MMRQIVWDFLGDTCQELHAGNANGDLLLNLSKAEVDSHLHPTGDNFFVQVPASELNEKIISELDRDCRLRIRSGNSPNQLISWFFPTLSGLLKRCSVSLHYTDNGKPKAISHRIVAIDRVFSECGIFNSQVKPWPYNS